MFAWAADAPLQWRLLAGNNREAGRGALSYEDADRCRIAVRALQAALDQTQATVRRTASNLWTWQLTLNGGVIAAAGREYDRMIRCEQAVEAFVRGMRAAPIHDAVIISNSRRWASRSMGEPIARFGEVKQ
jgi:hypothetical protein